jgi:hypothetical protein
MHQLMSYLKNTGYLGNEDGIETLEWIAMGAVIVALALLVYPGTLATAINAVIGKVSAKLAT